MDINIPINTCILGDAQEVLKTFPDNCIQLCLTSPPYDSLRSYENSLDWNFDIFKNVANELYRVTKEGGVVVWVIGDSTIDGNETGTSFKQALYFKEIGYSLLDTMIYQKKNFSHPSKNRYHQVFEYMFVFSKGKLKTFNPIKDRVNISSGKIGSLGTNTFTNKDGSKSTRRKKVVNEYGMRHNVWKMNTVGQEQMCKELCHPAMFPMKLAEDHIISWSNENDIILDPFAGSGTTLIAAKKLNRQFIGIEKVTEYYNIINERLR